MRHKEFGPGLEIGMTPERLHCYAVILEVWTEFGHVTLREVARRRGVTLNAVAGCVRRLARDGFLEYQAGRHATLRPLYQIGIYRKAKR